MTSVFHHPLLLACSSCLRFGAMSNERAVVAFRCSLCLALLEKGQDRRGAGDPQFQALRNSPSHHVTPLY